MKSIKCMLGVHDTTSYFQQYNYENLFELAVRLLKLNPDLDNDELFSDICATRCRKCDYIYQSDDYRPTDHSIFGEVVKPSIMSRVRKWIDDAVTRGMS